MIDRAGFSDLRSYIKRRIAYARYRADGVYHRTELNSVEILSNGTVRAQIAITGLGQITVDRVELFNSDQELWAHEDINIVIKTGQTGILYWFDFTVKEEET